MNSIFIVTFLLSICLISGSNHNNDNEMAALNVEQTISRILSCKPNHVYDEIKELNANEPNEILQMYYDKIAETMYQDDFEYRGLEILLKFVTKECTEQLKNLVPKSSNNTLWKFKGILFI